MYAGKTFQLAGPAEYNYKELAEFVADITIMNSTLRNVSATSASLAGRVVEQLVSPVLTADMVAQLQEDVLPKNNEPNWLTMKDLNIEPSNMERVAFEFLHRFREGGHFRLAKGYH